MLSLIRCAFLALAAVLTICPAPSFAQAARAVGLEAMAGAGSGHGGEFFDTGFPAAHLGVTVRVRQRGSMAVYGEGGYDWLGLGMGHKAVCIPSSRGGCKPAYPDMAGPTGSLGVLLVPSRRIETRVGVGAAAYSVDGTRVGAVIGQLNAAWFVTPHIGLVVGGRAAVVPGYRHDLLSAIPVLLGLRLR